MNLATINEVIKASPAIQIQSKMTLLQRRAWNVLLANAYNELLDKDIHTISMAELAKKLGFDSHNEDYLKETLEALVDCTVKWNLLNKDKKQVWGVASLLGSAEIENGICTYSFTAHLRLKLHNPRIYAKLNLRLQNLFRSKYALVFWEVCFDYFDADRGQGETPFIPLDTFKVLLGLEKDDYPIFSEFNRSVIKPAIKEINELTNYCVEIELKRLVRKVAALKLRITRVKQLPVQDSLFPDIENLPAVAVELIQVGIDRQMALKIAEQDWKFVNPEKLPGPGRYSDFLAYVSEKLEMSVGAMGVKNRAGYIVEALRENYQDPELQKHRAQRAEKAKQKQLGDLKTEFHAKRNTLLRQAVHADPHLVERAAARVESYIVRQRLGEYATPLAAYQMGGVVAAEINHILAEELCQELIAPVKTAYEDERDRILAENS